MQFMIITIALLTQKNVTMAQYNLVSPQIADFHYLRIKFKTKLCVSRTHNCKPPFAHPGI